MRWSIREFAMTEMLKANVDTQTEQAFRTAGKFKRGWVKLRRNKAALVGGLLILVYVATAILAPVLFPGNPSAPNLIKALETPSGEYLLGTDELGRSILGRIIYGSRVSLLIAVGVVSFGLLFGVPLGLISGYYGGKIDFCLQRVTDMLLAFPGFLLALALVAVLGVGINNTVISIGISMVPLYIRLVRGCVLSVREEALPSNRLPTSACAQSAVSFDYQMTSR